MPTLTGQRARQLAEAGVSSNGEWTPYTEEINGVEMALVPAGCFMMGTRFGDSSERPAHEVCFDEPFWVDVYEVTNARFAAFLNEMDYQTQGAEAWFAADAEDVLIGESGGIWAPLEGKANHPVNTATWFGAVAYCEWRGARLPTEAEWEYTARGPDGLVYPWGSVFVADNIVYELNAPGGPARVGSRPDGVSWIGVFNLGGNVSEWVADWFDADYYDTLPSPVTNPTGPDGGTFRVLRGGSWISMSRSMRAAERRRARPDSVYLDDYGFRCARSYEPGAQAAAGSPQASTDTATPTDTPTPVPTLTGGQRAVRQLAEAGVSYNDEWTPNTEEINGVEMALVPAGCFMMGSTDEQIDYAVNILDGKRDWFTDEQPVHKVCFDEPFWIDAHEVTNARFAAFLSEMGNQTEGGATWLDTSHGYAPIRESGGVWVPLEGYADHPVIEVTWYGAAAYCKWRGARLSTEAEWEYAARGPDGLMFPWGDEFVPDNAVYVENSDGQAWEVGSKPGDLSWVGALDMSGNVWEWVSTWYAPYPYDPADGREERDNPGGYKGRVLRGGSWYLNTLALRAASRGRSDPDDPRDISFGFRCAHSYDD